MLTQLPRYLPTAKQPNCVEQEMVDPSPRGFDEGLRDAFVDNLEEFENLRVVANTSRDWERRHRPIAFEQRIINSQHLVRQAQLIMHNTLVAVAHGRSIPIDKLQSLVKKIINHIDRHADSLLYVARNKTKQEYTYMRSVSFCIVALDFCRTLGFSDKDLMHIGVGALLHDAGKMWISTSLLNKPGKLNSKEYGKIKQHIKYSYLIFYSNRITNPLAKNISLQHHERNDGSGYPRGLYQGNISLIGQLAAIVDVYDAATSTRCYKNALEPISVLRYLLKHSTDKFEKELVEKFIQHIGIFPTGTAVKLNNGLIGIVTEKSNELLKPVVKVVYDDVAKRLLPSNTVHLENIKGLQIDTPLLTHQLPFNPKRFVL